ARNRSRRARGRRRRRRAAAAAARAAGPPGSPRSAGATRPRRPGTRAATRDRAMATPAAPPRRRSRSAEGACAAWARAVHNSVMPRKFLRRHLPTPSALRAHRALRPVGRWLQDPELWHLHRRSVSGAAFIGLFVAFLPIPFQMLVAAVLAVIARCNLPLSVALVWITNPVTMPPMLYFAYQLGAWLLDRRVEVGTIELNWTWLSAHLGDIGWPLLFGSLVCG